MNRRKFLSRTSLGVLSASSGCAALELNTGTPEGMTIESRQWARVTLENGVEGDMEAGEDAPVIATSIIGNQETAENRIDSESPAAAFIFETDFENAYIAVVEYYGMSSSNDLELRSLERGDSTIHIVAEVKESSGGTLDDQSIHSLVLRITDEEAGVPDESSAEVVSCGFIRCTDYL